MIPCSSLPSLQRLLECTVQEEGLELNQDAMLELLVSDFQSKFLAERSFHKSTEPIRAVRQLLGALNGVVEKAFTTIMERGRKMGICGIDSLSDAILFQIVQFAKEPVFDLNSTFRFSIPIVKLSHISSRFRRVILGKPELWTAVSTSYALDQLEAFLLRSQTLPLDVTLSSAESPSRRPNSPRVYEQALAALIIHSNRWKSICDPDKQIWKFLVSSHPTLRMDCLESVNFPDPPPIPDGWDTPNLTKIHLNFLLNRHLKPSITECISGAIELGSKEAYIKHLKMLCHFPAFAKLTFALVDSGHPTNNVRWLQQGPHCTLANLRDLNLQFEFNANWASLLAVIDMPSLERLRVYMDEKHDAQETGFVPFVRAWNRSTLVFPKLKELRLIYVRCEDLGRREEDTGDPSKPLDLLDGLLRKMPLLNYCDITASPLKPLYFDYINGNSTINPFVSRPPPEEIRYKECHLVDEGYLRGLAEGLKENSRWSALKILRITRLERYTEDFAKELEEIYGEKLKWLGIYEL